MKTYLVSRGSVPLHVPITPPVIQTRTHNARNINVRAILR